MDFGAWVPKNGKGRAVAPIESFTRFQLAAIIDFHRYSIYRIWRLGWLAGWAGCAWLGLAGWLFQRFAWISDDFMKFHGFQGSGVRRLCRRLKTESCL